MSWQRKRLPPDPFNGTRVAVIGAGGFVGRWVARALWRRGARVQMIVRDADRVQRMMSDFDVGGEILQADLERPGEIVKAIAAARPAVTFNLAGYGVDPVQRDSASFARLNAEIVPPIVEGIAALSDPPAWAGVRLVHAGCGQEYGPLSGWLREAAKARPASSLGTTKLEGTRRLADACLRLGVKGISARLFSVYGPGDHEGRLLPALIEAGRTGQAAALTSGTEHRDFTYVEDVAEGLLRLAISAVRPNEVVNLSTGRVLTVREFVTTAAEILEIPGDRLLFGVRPPSEGQMRQYGVDVSRLQFLTSWTPPTAIADGIRLTVSFARMAPPPAERAPLW